MPEIPVYPLVTPIRVRTDTHEWFTNGHMMFRAGAAPVIPTRSAPVNGEPVSPGKLATWLEQRLPKMSPVLRVQFGCPVEPGMLVLLICAEFQAAVEAEYLFAAMAAAPGAELHALYQDWPQLNDTGIRWSQGEVALVRGGRVDAVVKPCWPSDPGDACTPEYGVQLRHAQAGPRVHVRDMAMRQPTEPELRRFWEDQLDRLREEREDLAGDLAHDQDKIIDLEKSLDNLRKELPVQRQDLLNLDALIASRQMLVGGEIP